MNVVRFRGNSGFTIPEILVSSVIVTITALMVTQFVSQQERTQRRQLSRGSCHAYSQLVRQRLMSMGSRATIVQWSAGGTDEIGAKVVAMNGSPTWGRPGIADTPPYIDPVDRWGNVTPLPSPWTLGLAPDARGITFENHSLINGTMAALTAIYRHDQTCGGGSNQSCYCINAEGLDYNYIDPTRGDSLLPATFQGLVVNNRKIKIQYLDPNGTTSCPQNLIMAPVATGPRQIAEKLGVNKIVNIDKGATARVGGALMVKVTVDYSNPQGAASRCTSTMRFAYPPDGAPPGAFPGTDYNNEAVRIDHVQNAAGSPFFGLSATDNYVNVEEANTLHSLTIGVLNDIATSSSDYVIDDNVVTSESQKATPYSDQNLPSRLSCGQDLVSERSASFSIKFNQSNTESGSLLVCRDASVMVKKKSICLDSTGAMIDFNGNPLLSNQGALARWMPVAMDATAGPGPMSLANAEHPMRVARNAQLPASPPPGSPYGGNQVSPERMIYDNQYFMFNSTDSVVTNNAYTYGFRLNDPNYMATAVLNNRFPNEKPYTDFGQDPAIVTSVIGGIRSDYGRWVRCETVSVCGQAPAAPANTYTNGDVDITLSYGNLPEGCLAKLEWAFIDSAGNMSQVNSIEKAIRVGSCGEYCGTGHPSYDSYFQAGYFQCGGCP